MARKWRKRASERERERECHLRPKYFCIELLVGHQGRKTKRLALMIVIVKTARSTKENK